MHRLCTFTYFLVFIFSLCLCSAAQSSVANHTSHHSFPHSSRSTSSHSFLPRPTPLPAPHPTPFHPSVFHPHPSSSAVPDRPIPPHHKSQTPIIIFFEVLGGIALLVVIVSFIRCFYVYKSTPKQDRIAAILQRHQLQRELEDIERNTQVSRRHGRFPSILEPAPPYVPPPPSYDGHGHTVRGNYEGLASTSPPSSPPMSQILLERQS